MRAVAHIRAQRYLTIAFIAWTLVAFAGQAFPADSVFHEQLNRFFGPYLSMTGTWIGSTSFFAPAPPKEQMLVEGRVYYADGSFRSWQTPEVSSLSYWQKFISNRDIKYFDNLYRDSNSATWPFFAHYLIDTMQNPSLEAKRVELIRHWRITPPPGIFYWTSLQVWNPSIYPNEYVFYRSEH